ncbi:oligosaccharide flippase family protein [Tenacibaculum sp. nBUS_03]|uniref:oligosaccharide flippase family protein n=1 Tax=Tenacibaculum sp. nBUS_03 TaxID=3395320 RepID=UPI003EB9F139
MFNIKSILSISVILIASRFSLMVFNLLIVRFLPVEDYGRLTYADSILSLVTVIGGLGLHTIGIKEISQKNDNFNTIFTNVVSARVLFTLFLSILSVFLFYNKGYTSSFILFNFLFTFFQVLLIDWFLIAIDAKKVLLISILSGLIGQYILFYYFFETNQITIENIRLSQFLNVFITTSIMFLNCFKHFELKEIRISKVKKYLKLSLPLLGSYAFQQTYYAGIPMAITSFLGFYEVGLYGAASRLALVLVTLRNIVLQPLSKDLYRFNINQYLTFFKKYFRNTILLIVFYYVTIYLYSEEILYILYGDKYTGKEIINIFRLMMLLPIIYFIFIGDGAILTSTNNQKYILYSSLFASLSVFSVLFILKDISNFVVSFLFAELLYFSIMRYNILKLKKQQCLNL